MSVQFGRWHFDGARPTPEYLEAVEAIVKPFGREGIRCYRDSSIDVLFSALHTTKESISEFHPHISANGTVLTWDGRLDNRAELIALHGGALRRDASDAALIAAAYLRSGPQCFATLLGDWALSIWEPRDHSLLLAKDPMGMRPLFYSCEARQVIWSSVLDPLILLDPKNLRLNEEYIAGYFSLFPATHLTPYQGVHSVPPSSYVHIRPGFTSSHRYWDFDPSRRSSCRTDAEYEEHFRSVFGQSVRRRLRSHFPVLAELSGGIDSSSIVCVADRILTEEKTEESRLDTLSYFCDSEPNWNERPFVSKVEEKRGRVGWHIDLDKADGFSLNGDVCPQVLLGRQLRSAAPGRERASHLRAGGYRAVLSGIGGDEFTGGIPTPVPELADLIARLRPGRMAHQLKLWSLAKRTPWFYLFAQAIVRFLPFSFANLVADSLPPPRWLSPKFVNRYRYALSGYQQRIKLFGSRPSFQENLATLDAVRRQIACDVLPSDPPYDVRYPFLDRDLLEFLFATPREQLVRPGQRRSLVRRALVGIVPDAILNRRRKAYVSRTPLRSIAEHWDSFAELSTNMVAESLGIVSSRELFKALEKARAGQQVPIVSVMRTLELEVWLRSWNGNALSYRSGKRCRLGSDERCESTSPMAIEAGAGDLSCKNA